MTLYHLNVAAHLLAALFWLGGMFFLAAVGAPAIRRLEDPALRARLFEDLGRRFRRAGWGASYGRVRAWKLTGVGTMVVVSALHDFVLGPAAARSAAAGRTGARRWAAWLARANALVGIGVVLAAVRLARGG